ncbi:MAG: DUF3592 domain-containing protein [Akkermansia sp.]|nr:DUF3592 domain-containing protein [Akkermansia sp.]
MNSTTFIALTVPEEYQPYAFFALGLVVIGFGLFELKKSLYLTRHGMQTEGILQGIRTSRSLSSGKHEPVAVYTYTDMEGNEHEITDSLPPVPLIGKSRITVLYDPANPENAMVATTASITPIIFILSGIIGVAYGISELFS